MVGRNMKSKTHPKKAENIFAHKKKAFQSGKASEQAKSDMFCIFVGLSLKCTIYYASLAYRLGWGNGNGTFFTAKTKQWQYKADSKH